MTIVMTWAAHCVLLALMLTAGAFAWEKQARWSGGAARWGWLGALAGTVSLPWLLRLLPAGASEALPVAIPLLTLEPVVLDGPVAAAAFDPARAALLLWAMMSLLVLLYVAYMLVRLRAHRRRWQEAELDGGAVLLTERVGPAAVGLRGRVIVPRWALQLDGDLRALLLQHEREHVRAGDPALLLAGLLLLAAMPWNPFVWLQVLRLRNAIELDCDARVLASGADPERYGSLLLEVGRRQSSRVPVMATFAEPRIFLEERIRRISRWPLRRSRARALAFALTGCALFGVATCTPDPLRPRGLPTEPVDAVPPVTAGQQGQESGPVFTPMTERPELINREEVVAALRRSYPPLLRDAGIGGSAVVWIHVDSTGTVSRLQNSRSSGYPALDQAALGVAAAMKFRPARNGNAPAAVWIELPISYSAEDEEMRGRVVADTAAVAGAAEPRPARSPAGRALRVPQPGTDLAAEPAFTPMTVRPELLNRREVAAAMDAEYPPLLRSAGIGGSPVVWFFIDRTGTVAKVQLSRSSGYPALDEAGLRLASQMKFSAARNGDEPVPVWVEIPVTFRVR